ncbi:hypothetical protein [Nannocystis punicea]|uniref:Lipoprotein n=1 Tax=Nannocystis punicea TaxID=2995304 RepID=A0ABY7HIF9_9BACT|nr:hypothetical protein [Nannocystis poenicansa]WAS98840.1 hypothetical protein O0S08_22140 [Nannocystis poenicansa]
MSSSSIVMHRCGLVVLLAMTGCYEPLDEEEDYAEVYVVPPGVDDSVWGVLPGELDYLEGERLVVRAFFHYEGKLKRPTCEIAVVGDALTIQTSVEYKHVRGDGGLWYARTECQTGPMDAGTYTIVFDGRERSLTIPSTAEPPSFR